MKKNENEVTNVLDDVPEAYNDGVRSNKYSPRWTRENLDLYLFSQSCFHLRTTTVSDKETVAILFEQKMKGV